jgi:basic membrane protein A
MFFSHKKVALLCLLLLLAVLLGACKELQLSEEDAGLTLFGEGSPRVALITGTEGVTGAYYASAWTALEQLSLNRGAGVAYVRADTVKDYDTRCQELQKKGADVIIAFGQNAVPALTQAALADPDSVYVIVDALWPDAEIPGNVLIVNYKGEEAGYLAGMLAGSVTETRVLGFLCTQETALTTRYYLGFRAGASQVRNNLETLKGLSGEAPTRAHIGAMATQMQVNDVDIVFHTLGGTAAGILDATGDKPLYMIGSEVNQNALGAEVLCSVVKRHDLVLTGILQNSAGVTGGKELWVGLAEDAWELVRPEIEVGEEMTAVYEKIEVSIESIVDGEIEIPYSDI